MGMGWIVPFMHASIVLFAWAFVPVDDIYLSRPGLFRYTQQKAPLPELHVTILWRTL